MFNTTDRLLLGLKHAPIPHLDKVALTRHLVQLEISDDFNALGGVLRMVYPLLSATGPLLPDAVAADWHGLKALTIHGDVLGDWAENRDGHFDNEFQAFPILAGLDYPITSPRQSEIVLMKQLLLAAALIVPLNDLKARGRLNFAADQIRLACKPGSTRERTLARFEAGPFDVATLAAVFTESNTLRRRAPRDLNPALLRAIRFLAGFLHESPRQSGDLSPLVTVSTEADGSRIVELRAPTPASDGSIAEPVRAVVVDPGPHEHEDVSNFQANQQVERASYALADAEDWLPYRFSSFDPDDLKTLRPYLKTLDHQPQDPVIRFFLGLCAATELSVDDACVLPFGPNGALTPDGQLRKDAPLPEASFRPAHDHLEQYENTHAEEFTLMLPRPVRALLKEVVAGREGGTLGEALGLSAEDPAKITRQITDLLKAIVGPHAGTRQLKRLLRDQVGAVTHDPVVTSIVASPAVVALPITSAYLSLSVKRILNAYRSALDPLFGPAPDSRDAHSTIGSRCAPDHQKLRVHIQASIEKSAAIISDKTRPLSERHNAFVLHVYDVITASGLRPVKDAVAFARAIGDHHMVGEDKAPNEKHNFRPIPLCPTIRSQTKSYLDYLPCVAAMLLEEAHTVQMGAAIIKMLTHPYREGMLPFLFLLSDDCTEAISLSPKVISALRPNSPYPDNLSRHLLATGLTNLGVPAHLRQLQLGHLAKGHVHVGDSSCLSLDEVCDQLQGPLEALVTSIGLRTLLNPLKTRPTLAIPSGVVPYSHGVLGPLERERGRRSRRIAAKAAVRTELANMVRGTTINQADFERIRYRLAAHTQDDADVKERAELLWWRYCRRQRNGRPPLIPPSRFQCFEAAYPTCWREQPFYAAVAKLAVERFTKYLARECGLTTPAADEQMAEHLVSAALLGAHFNPRDLDFLRTLDQEDHVALLGLVMHERTDANGVCTRWAADPFSAALLDRKRKGNAKPGKSAVLKALRNLLAIIAPEVDAHNPIRALTDMGRAYWRSLAPGYLFAYADGSLDSTSLRQDTWARLLTGKRLKSKEIEGARTRRKGPAHTRLGQPGSLAETRAVYKELRRLIGSIRQERTVGRIHSRAAETRAFLAKFDATLGPRIATLPGIAGALAAWARSLAADGTSIRPRLALSSVLRYICALHGLVDAAHAHDLGALTGENFEDLYARVLAVAPKDGRAYIGNRILEFHQFLTWMLPVDDPDWAFLPRSGARRVDANVISHLEYRRCLTLLKRENRFKEAALLVLGYRFGLRAGEAARLRNDDLILRIRTGRAIVIVESNFLGATKSPAGVRRIPLIGEFDEDEQDVLVRLKEEFASRIERTDNRAGLFANPDDTRAQITCQKLFQCVHEALRRVTGDSTLRYHHLRHSFGTRLMLGLVGDRYDSRPLRMITTALYGGLLDHKALRRLVTGDETCGPMTLRALPALLGHATFETSIASYVHVMDVLLAAECDRHLPAMPIAAWSYALGDKVDTIRKRRKPRTKSD